MEELLNKMIGELKQLIASLTNIVSCLVQTKEKLQHSQCPLCHSHTMYHMPDTSFKCCVRCGYTEGNYVP